MAFLEKIKKLQPMQWVAGYDWRRNLSSDFVAGLTVAMMLVPQEISLAEVMHVPTEYGLYTAVITPFVYSCFGSSNVLSVANTAHVSLLVGAALQSFESEKERIAVGILISFLSGIILLLLRALNLSALADYFSRPAMSGFMVAAGFLIILSQIPAMLTIETKYTPFPPLALYRILEMVHETELYSLIVGASSVTVMLLLRKAKQRFFNGLEVNDVLETSKANGKDPADMISPASMDQVTTPTSADEACFVEIDTDNVTRDSRVDIMRGVKSSPSWKCRKTLMIIGRLFCDLGPLLVCVTGAMVGWALGERTIRVTGTVPGGFPSPIEPWYGLYELIDLSMIGTIIGDALLIVAVLYMWSTALTKKFAIERGEEFQPDKELVGLGLANLVGSFFKGMPASGTVSCTAVNHETGKTKLASVITTLFIVVTLYMPEGTFYYLPRASVASIIFVAGASLVEFHDAKWLFRVKRDEFYVWMASFLLTLGLGVLKGLIASIVASVVALMYKTKRPPVVIMEEVANGVFESIESSQQTDQVVDILAFRVSGSLYFANCEHVFKMMAREIVSMEGDDRIPEHALRGVILDALRVNDVDATSIQVLSDFQKVLFRRNLPFAICNANSRVKEIFESAGIHENLVGRDPTLSHDEALRLIRTEDAAIFMEG